MLCDYDDFVVLLKHHGEAASGMAVVEPSNAASLVGSSSIRSLYATAVAVTPSDAARICGNAYAAAEGGAGATSTAILQPPSVASEAPQAGTAASSQRDTILFILGDAGGSTTLPWFAGVTSQVTLTHESPDVPMNVLVPLLFSTIRGTTAAAQGTASSSTTGGVLLTVDASQHRAGASPVPLGGAMTAPPILAIDIRGPIRKQLCVPLVRLDPHSDRRRAAHAILTHVVLRSHTTVMQLLERERRLRAEAEESLSRAQAALLEHGGDAVAIVGAGRGAGGRDGAASRAARMQRPASVLNPQQRGPLKRPRGVKLN